MQLTQGTFSFLPPLSDAQITKQAEYALNQGWSIGIEYTDDPHPLNSYWEMYGLPMFDVHDPAVIMERVEEARNKHANYYVKVNAFDSRLGRPMVALSFIVHRPSSEPGFRLDRTSANDRVRRYTIHSYATDAPEDQRYPS